MNFENTLFFMPLLVGTIFIVAAYIMLKFPPKKINYLYGYRTKSSMKNQEHWHFSQIYSSKLMLYCGFGLIAFSGFGLLFKVSIEKGVLISTVFLFIVTAILFIKTEKAIKQKFKNEN